MSFFVLLITLTALIFVHEVGHLVAARLIGVKVRTISIGFGRGLYSYQDRTGTLWKLSIFPLGGYVQLDEDNRTNVNYGNQGPAKFFNSCSFIEKSFVALAGPFANIIFAFFRHEKCYFLFFFLTSQPWDTEKQIPHQKTSFMD